MLQLLNVTRRFGKKTVLKDLTYTFPARGIVALMGPSGCGKTTLLRLLAGLDRPDGGEVQSSYAKTAVSFQEPRLIPWLNCEDNIKIVLPKGNTSSETIAPILGALELSEAKKSLPSALSGGMKQRLSLARALAFGGDLLLLDEPFSALDEALKARIAPSLRAANPDGLTVLITHDPDDAELLGATVLHLTGDPVHALTPN
ncbi:MAG: ABC transporter ATP-binding protein [Clostridia bacterium]|nr:ABC transporter ATP-binding protein [Clostridia bacterium]